MEIMEKIDHLPAKAGIIGFREVVKGIKAGKIKKVAVASNCPQNLISEISTTGIQPAIFVGDQRELGARLGKPFAIAVVGYE